MGNPHVQAIIDRIGISWHFRFNSKLSTFQSSSEICNVEEKSNDIPILDIPILDMQN